MHDLATILHLPTPGTASALVWRDDTLIDWVSSGTRYGLDGACAHGHYGYRYRFDAAIDCAPYTVLYQRRGTKGLVLEDGRIIRELNRSFYCADAYEYPVALWRANSGRVLLAHCPDDYNRIELEDAATGERLSARADREPSDFFHSGLAVSPNGRRILSAGWCWHPFSIVQTLELARAIEDPLSLDNFDDLREAPSGLDPEDDHEQYAAAWQSDDRILVSYGSTLASYDFLQRAFLPAVKLDHPVGIMMPVGLDRVVTFYEHPRLVSLVDGRTLAEWPEIHSGKQVCTVGYGIEAPPPIALDWAQKRFAVALEKEIAVVVVGE
jgi:hypothetical protein